MAGVTRYTIAEMEPNVTNAMIVAIIIAKQPPRIFSGKKDTNEQRGVWKFTLRDSPTDTINACVWGGAEYVTHLAEAFRVGDIVEIVNARVTFRQGGVQEEKYDPYVSSGFTLSLSEVHSSVQPHEEAASAALLSPLLRLTTKPTTEFLTLADVERRDQGTASQLADLLVAVNKVDATRHIRRKDGRPSQCRDVQLMDYTTSGVPMTLWDRDLIERADQWRPGKTILFLADVRVEWSSYKGRVAVSVGPRTVVTEDPQSAEADTLREYTSREPLLLHDQIDHISASLVNPQSVNTVLSVREVLAMLHEQPHGEPRSYPTPQQPQPSYGLLFCLISALNLDGPVPLLTARCLQCREFVDERVGVCERCAAHDENPPQSVSFDLRVSLSDHTGTLAGVHLTGQTAEKVLGIKAAEFSRLDIDARTALKWRLLLERCAVRVVVLPRGSCPSRPQRALVSMLDCELADPREAAARYPTN